MIRWIIQNFSKDESYTELAKEVKKQGHPLIEIKGDYKNSDLDGVKNNERVIFNGSIKSNK